MRASRLAVHALTRADRALAELFGGETGDDIDKFSRCDWIAAGDGTPILSQAGHGFSARSSGESTSATTSDACWPRSAGATEARSIT
jgi:hypothetical protein